MHWVSGLIVAVLVAILLGSGTVSASPISDATEGFDELVVPVDQPSPEWKAATGGVRSALAGVEGRGGGKPQFIVAESGQGVLWGDLFGTGGCFALVEVAADMTEGNVGVAFAEWRGEAWQLRQVWKIGTVWRRKGWEDSEDDYLPATPATQPFALKELSGDGVPEVVVAGGVWKYFQENFLLRFLPKTKELKLVAYAMAKPEKVGDYVRLYFDSGRRAIWSEWEFCKWEGDKLVPEASWHSETGYNETDSTFSEGMRRGADGQPVTIRVLYGHGHEIEGDRYELSRNGEPFGTMRIAWKDPEHPPADFDEMEEAWLFEKITGLPRRLCPRREETTPIGKLEGFATVTINGDAEAVRFFEARR